MLRVVSSSLEQQQQQSPNRRTASVGAGPSYQAVSEDARSLAEEGTDRTYNNNNNASTRRRSESGAGSSVDDDSDRELAEAEVIMGLSSELTSRPGESSDHTRYMLGWEAMRNWFASLQPSELIRLNMSNSEQPRPRGDTFNYDHVSSSYGPGAGYTSDTTDSLLSANGGSSRAQTHTEDMSVNATTTTTTSTTTSTTTAAASGRVNSGDGSGSGSGVSGLRT